MTNFDYAVCKNCDMNEDITKKSKPCKACSITNLTDILKRCFEIADMGTAINNTDVKEQIEKWAVEVSTNGIEPGLLADKVAQFTRAYAKGHKNITPATFN